MRWVAASSSSRRSTTEAGPRVHARTCPKTPGDEDGHDRAALLRRQIIAKMEPRRRAEAARRRSLPYLNSRELGAKHRRRSASSARARRPTSPRRAAVRETTRRSLPKCEKEDECGWSCDVPKARARKETEPKELKTVGEFVKFCSSRRWTSSAWTIGERNSKWQFAVEVQMSSDPNKKSPRTFQCRDVLWETFEQMARELECSVDYLINEAMKQYARQRSYGGARRRIPDARTRAAERRVRPPPSRERASSDARRRYSERAARRRCRRLRRRCAAGALPGAARARRPSAAAARAARGLPAAAAAARAVAACQPPACGMAACRRACRRRACRSGMQRPLAASASAPRSVPPPIPRARAAMPPIQTAAAARRAPRRTPARAQHHLPGREGRR